MSIREAARVFDLHRETVSKMLRYSVPPGYRRSESTGRAENDLSLFGLTNRIVGLVAVSTITLAFRVGRRGDIDEREGPL